MNKNLTKALEVIQSEKFELTTIEKFSQAYVFVRQIKEVVEKVEKQAKRKGFDMMCDEEMKSIEMESYRIVKQDPTETSEYLATKIVEALGIERAIAFLKVDKKSLDFYLKRGYQSGAVSSEELAKCQEGMFKKMRKGFIKLVKK